MLKDPPKSGFAFGVILGTVAGLVTALSSDASHQHLSGKLLSRFRSKLELLKDKYPHQIQQLESTLAEALQKHEEPTPKATKSPKTSSKRTFTRSGKKV